MLSDTILDHGGVLYPRPKKFRCVYDATMGGVNRVLWVSHFPLPTLEDFCASFYPGCLLCKNDFRDFFYTPNSSVEGAKLFGFKCPATGRTGCYRSWPMGASSTPHNAMVYTDLYLERLRQQAPFVGRRRVVAAVQGAWRSLPRSRV